MKCIQNFKKNIKDFSNKIANKIHKRNLKKIFEEIKKDNIAYIRFLIKKKDHGLNAKGENGMSAILIAAQFAKKKILR
jgi:hypothetical protein